MKKQHGLSDREKVFVASLRYHGYRFTRRRKNLKLGKRYVVPATRKEDSDGIDFWIKQQRSSVLIPVQVTQRGVRLYRKHQQPSAFQLNEFIKQSEVRIQMKRRMCIHAKIVFVLLCDVDGKKSNATIAHRDIRALRTAIHHMRRRL